MFLWIIRGERGGRYMCLQKCSLWQIVDARDMKVYLCNAMLTPGWCTGWRVQDAAKRQKCKMARNGIDEDPWGVRQRQWVKFEFYGLLKYSDIDAEIWREIFLLVYLTINLWTITPALINSLGPSIAVSVLHKNLRQQRGQENMKREWRIFKIQDARYNWPDIKHQDNEQA